ncbi:hypothetical protein CEXT_521961 [Caerostris extrusa]|uniref:Uncharacterized protein n=1 Tax=Caerostris extrusa TaxID=172846 RepID=A0AAV4ST11_CAEEX|nr:hypothetical protein CEXT_521961 [Caerostris extrusa]
MQAKTALEARYCQEILERYWLDIRDTEHVREFSCGHQYYRTFHIDTKRDVLYVGAITFLRVQLVLGDGFPNPSRSHQESSPRKPTCRVSIGLTLFPAIPGCTRKVLPPSPGPPPLVHRRLIDVDPSAPLWKKPAPE